MPLRSRVKLLLAERNVELVRQGKKAISILGLSQATGITHSALIKFVNGQSSRVDFETLDRLMQFFETRDLNQILEYISEDQLDGSSANETAN